MNTRIKWGLIIIGTIVVCFLGFVYLSTYQPDDTQQELVINSDKAPVLIPGQQIKVLSWNIQFMAGNIDNHFFFDGGNDPWPTQETIDKTAKNIAQILIEEDADIVLLQEVDDGAKRTHYEDQLEKLLKLLPESYVGHTSTIYWKAFFIPYPDIVGSVGMKLSIISKYQIRSAVRYALSPITTDNIIVRQFQPKRAVLEVLIPLADGKVLNVLNTHLSAFAQGSDTMLKQVAQVDHILEDLSLKRKPAFVAGDFNLLPPGDAYSRLNEEGKRLYNPSGTEIKTLFDKYRVIPGYPEVTGENYKQWFTNMATNSKSKLADRTIDYLISTKGITIDTCYVRSAETNLISDHLPLIVSFTIPPQNKPSVF